MTMSSGPIWVARDYVNCSGCRRCEVACSLKHEGKIWPEASRIRVFMLVPTLEVPHFCAQCEEPACVPGCPAGALSVNKETKAIMVDKEKCTSCGQCIEACPGRVPVMHPTEGYALICDLCDGDPECANACQEGRYNALWKAKRATSISYDLYAKTPDKVTRQLAHRFYHDLPAEGLLE